MDTAATTFPKVDYQTHPDRYRHYKVSYDGPVATLALDIDEDAGIRPGYKLKLNSYDLGVDIELHDAIQRIRFEHPEVRSVIVTESEPCATAAGVTRTAEPITTVPVREFTITRAGASPGSISIASSVDRYAMR